MHGGGGARLRFSGETAVLKISAPGNILILGEYAVLEEGGLGAAAAVDAWVHLDSVPDSGLAIDAVMPGGSFTWTRDRPDAGPLISAIVDAVEASIGTECDARRIRIDSSALFGEGGRKAGFGSSAAVSAALVAALLARPDAGAVVRTALAAHRSAQGGTGSGYDVHASVNGGLGLFRGGIEPSWEKRDAGRLTGLYVFPGPQAVSTRSSIDRFLQWKKRNPGLALSFLDRSNRIVRSFLWAESASAAADALRAGRDLGIELGDSIGVNARIPVPDGLDPDLCKSVGAGNELGLYFRVPGAPEPPPAAGTRRVSISERGLTWET